jgi:hypothetical protein
MSNTNTGGPAFPTARVNINGVDEQDGIQAFGAGMTLRDYFAAKAMPFEFKDYWDCFAELENQTINEFWREEIAESCYAMADAMLRAREAA